MIGSTTTPRGELGSAISNAVVKLFSDYLGRGPTKARTVIARNMIAVVLEDTLTKAERRLISSGREETVLTTRRALQQTMRTELVGVIEELSGRTVLAFLSDHQSEPDYAVECFVLEPDPHDDATRHAAQEDRVPASPEHDGRGDGLVA